MRQFSPALHQPAIWVPTKGCGQPSTAAQGWDAMMTYKHMSQIHGLALHTQ